MDKAHPYSAPAGGTVLLTGGTGFLGSHIMQHLVEAGIPVRALTRSSKRPFYIPAALLDRVDWVEGDVLDVVSLQDAMAGVSAVIHAAAIVSFSKDNRRQMYAVNVEGTSNVVNTALESGVKRLLHVSSVAALGRTTQASTVNEEKKWEENRSNTHYAISKHHAEIHVWRGLAEGLDSVIINPSTILGFGNWNESSCAIFKNAYREFPWYTNGVNGFVGVHDAAAAAVQLLQSSVSGQRFIVNAENWAFRNLFNAIADGFGRKRPHREATPAMGAVAWRLEKLKSMLTGKKPLLTRETAKVAHRMTRFDNAALLRALPGFSYTPLAEVVAGACRDYRKAVETGLLSI